MFCTQIMAVSFRAAAPQQSPNTLDSTPRRTGSAPRRLASRRAPPRVASRLGGLHPASCLRVGESLGASQYTRSTKSKNKTSCWLRGPAVQYGTRSSLPIAATCTTAIDMSSTNTQCDGYISGRIDVQPDDAREVAGLQGNNITTSADDEVARPLKTRKRFGPDEDLLLIKEVNWILPYRQGRNKVMKAWQGIAERLNKLSTFNMCSVNSKSCQNRFNTLLTRHRMQEVESARASGVDEEYTEFRGLMDDIVSDFDEWESERQRTKEQHVRESDAKETAGAVVRDSAMLRLRGQRLADAKRASEGDGNGEGLRCDASATAQSKETPTKAKHAILASLVPLMES
ncbi:hypothetical protein PF004_g28749 [Phytophthora fragariae]|uniref:Myb-like domain-containing protein n=3 Tax=Phytophthora fragariae TaxID=53985 RepID=A0A6G0MI28_9STRA|nr:hypothetical protein PF004_g28749 [Phytophthora fragariae]